MRSFAEVRLAHQIGGMDFQAEFSMDREVGVLFGPSGSGKTTILRTLAGLLRPRDVFIRLGERILADSRRGVWVPPHRRRVSLCFQSLALFPHMTVLENVAFGARYGGTLDSVARWVELVRLKGLEDRYPHQLSGGQRQRVALARAMASEPDMLLLDEPFSALDGPLRRSLRRELKAIQRGSGIPVIYVTHHMDDLCALGDVVFVVDQGRIKETFRIEEMLDPSRTASVYGALGWGNLVEGDLERREDGWHLLCAWGALYLGDREELRGGRVVAFISPEAVKPIHPDLPVDSRIVRNVFRGVVEEVLPMPSFVRLEVRSERHWQVDVPRSSSLLGEFVEGVDWAFAVPPDRIEVACGEC
ncbi:ABC transporter ATP-binding protein [Thermanaerovibrio acidaminovorans]|uniref:ABC transporter related protein n=1 Tax=Thermanaerovibrio acidaminovorans (strain ATCC 49978 / DSM 6589 / Su883) TaxID=525903 RepID=D1B731_THEAS|nr:ABC transporter ATP-binding protein [Thermanaerovibrio acidaminovorans]ACZ19822.1 ABC transporter related protein [Thermanaerovibrio acidaminovorans DSM 6589]